MHVPGGDNFRTILRFYDDLSAAQHRQLKGWLYTPQTHTLRSDRIKSSMVEGDDTTKSVQMKLQQTCRPLTLAQKSADLFLLRNFRLTATTKTALLLDYDHIVHTFSIRCRYAGPPKSPPEQLSALCASWFSQKKITEHMMRGTRNEATEISYMHKQAWVHAIYSCGILGMNDHT